MQNEKTYLSIVVPVFNEEENLNELHSKIEAVLAGLDKSSEVIFIDDGSFDSSYEILKDLSAKNGRAKLIRFTRNHGQTAALSAGFDHALGEIIIPLDADLQNDPQDIPRLLSKMDEGYDVVAGWRKNRQDKFFTKTLPSKIANWLISKITKVKLHDYGCTMKAYRKNALQNISLFGEMHRFIPAYAAWHGAKIAEIETNHHPRLRGKTKYTLWKTFKVILDIITVKFLISYLNRPMHFFGGAGFLSLLLSLILAAAALVLKFGYDVGLTRTPLLLLAALLAIIGVMFILLGLLAEIMIRVYFAAKNKESYTIKEKINF